jgi:hypothetical protein
MGMYTEIYINVDLKGDIPDEVLDVLQYMCGESDDGLVMMSYPHRWCGLFCNGSYYTPNTSCAKLTLDKISGQYSLLGKGDIKNYEEEIEQFFAWIMPHIDAVEGEFIGYKRYEESLTPTLYFKE